MERLARKRWGGWISTTRLKMPRQKRKVWRPLDPQPSRTTIGNKHSLGYATVKLPDPFSPEKEYDIVMLLAGQYVDESTDDDSLSSKKPPSKKSWRIHFSECQQSCPHNQEMLKPAYGKVSPPVAMSRNPPVPISLHVDEGTNEDSSEGNKLQMIYCRNEQELGLSNQHLSNQHLSTPADLKAHPATPTATNTAKDNSRMCTEVQSHGMCPPNLTWK